jgi:GTP-binding protein
MRENRVPVIAIVGRPNVGKSTLFNRIIGRQDAIVHGTPGVTRDRHYELTDWNGCQFMLVDTGGYVPQSHDSVDAAVREQAELAIDEADAVLFVIDAGSGLTVAEQHITDHLKRSGKRCVLVINKADNPRVTQTVMADEQIYRLGLSDPVCISAISGHNVGDLLDRVLTLVGEGFLRSVDEIAYKSHLLQLAVIGKPNVGKSSFVNAVTGENKLIVSDTPGTTRDSIHTDITFDGQRFRLIDTAGLRRRAKVKENIEFYSTLRTLKTIQECDVAVLLIDAVEGLADQDIRVLEEARQLKKGLLIAVNKWDLIEKDDKTYLNYERRLKQAIEPTTYVPVVFISSLTRQRVTRVLELAKTVHGERNKTISTSRLNRFLAEAIARNHPPAVRGKDIRINYITQIKSRPPVFALFSNEPALLPANYRQYLEHRMRETFGFAGVPLSLTFRKKSKDRVA